MNIRLVSNNNIFKYSIHMYICMYIYTYITLNAKTKQYLAVLDTHTQTHTTNENCIILTLTL